MYNVNVAKQFFDEVDLKIIFAKIFIIIYIIYIYFIMYEPDEFKSLLLLATLLTSKKNILK